MRFKATYSLFISYRSELRLCEDRELERRQVGEERYPSAKVGVYENSQFKGRRRKSHVRLRITFPSPLLLPPPWKCHWVKT